MATSPAYIGDLEKLRRDLEARMGRIEQAAARRPAGEPLAERLERVVNQLVNKVTVLERKVDTLDQASKARR